MKRALLFLGAIFVLVPPAAAQFTIVTGTVKDLNGIAYVGGTISAVLVVPGGTSPTLNGLGFTGSMSPIGLDSTGSFTARLADNNVVLPSGTQWKFLVNINSPPPLGTGQQTCTATLTITGASQSVSSSFGACPALSNITGTGGIASSLVSNTPNPALTGTIRLESADQQCWRNNANSADLCFNKNISDVLNWPSAFSIGGNTFTAGLINNNGQNNSGALNNSGIINAFLGVNISAGQSLQMGTRAVSGIQGTDSSMQSAGTISGTSVLLCTDANGGSTTVGCPSVAASVFQTTTLGSNVTVNNLTVTNVMSIALSALPSGCGTNGCRATVCYNIVSTNSNGNDNSYFMEAWVNDGTNNYAGSGGMSSFTNNSYFKSNTACATSTTQFSSGATPTFTLKVEANNETNNSVSVQTMDPVASIPSRFTVTIQPSN